MALAEAGASEVAVLNRTAVRAAEAAALAGGAGRVVSAGDAGEVAARADQQISVLKAEAGGRTATTAATVSGEDRVIELSRMLSGQPDSTIARRHARELLRAARSSMSG